MFVHIISYDIHYMYSNCKKNTIINNGFHIIEFLGIPPQANSLGLWSLYFSLKWNNI